MPITLEPISRRRFLGQSALAAAALSAGTRFAKADEPYAGDWCALVSDTHIQEDPMRVRAGHNVLANLTRVQNEILTPNNKPTSVIINGDMAFLGGEEGDYRTFVTSVAKLREAGLPIHMTLGNHDDRERFWRFVDSEGKTKTSVAEKHAAVLPARHVHWFLLDSLEKVGATPGSLGDGQIDWLDRELGRRKDKPAFVMAHHNFNYHFDVKEHAKEIVPCADKRLPAPGLADGKKLLDVFAAHPHVSAFFCGHTHQWNVVDWNGIYLVNLPASAYPFRDVDAVGWVACRTQPERSQLVFQSLDRQHKHHGQKVEIRHRG